MFNLNPRKYWKIGKAFFTKHSADILTGVTVGGIVLTAVETHKATRKVDEFLITNGYDQANPDTQKVLKWEARKNYIRPALVGAATIGAAVGANYLNHQKIAGLAAACALAENALTEHRDKVDEILGSKALRKIDDEINVDKGRDILKNDEAVIDTGHYGGHQKVLCCEAYFTGQKFYASPEWIQKSVNEFNQRVNQDTYAGVDEWLSALFEHNPGFDIPLGVRTLGYNVHINGLLRVNVTSDIDETTGLPCLIISPSNYPVSNYMEIL